MIDGPGPFTCVLCQKHQENRWPGSISCWDIPPICHYCEITWGLKTLTTAGTHRDRRYANQIKALAEALSATGAVS